MTYMALKNSNDVICRRVTRISLCSLHVIAFAISTGHTLLLSSSEPCFDHLHIVVPPFLWTIVKISGKFFKRIFQL